MWGEMITFLHLHMLDAMQVVCDGVCGGGDDDVLCAHTHTGLMLGNWSGTQCRGEMITFFALARLLDAMQLLWGMG